MSDFELLNLDSPVMQSSNNRKISTTLISWGEEDTENKEVPIHLFLNDESASPASSSSYSIKRKEKNIGKSSQKKNLTGKRREREKKQISFTKDYESSSQIFSMTDNSVSSSDSEYVSSGRSKDQKSPKSRKSKMVHKLNKVRDVESQKEREKVQPESGKNKSVQHQENRDEESPSPGYSSVDAELKKSITSPSEISYRERIRDRFNVMKEQAAESSSRPHLRSQSKLKLLISKQSGQKTEYLMKQEEVEVSAAIKRHERAKLRWRQISKLSVESEHKSQSECKNFFEETQKETDLKRTAREESEIPKESPSFEKNSTEESKMMASELLGIKEDWELVEFVQPRMEKNKIKLLRDDHIFYPSTKPVSLEDKLEPGLNPRFKEEEGLYEGNRDDVSSKMKRRMEQRVLKTLDGKKWFGKDGNLIPSNCVPKVILTRPSFNEGKSGKSVKVMFKPATTGNTNHQYIDLSANYVLDIDFNSIEFAHHPLFSREHVVSQRLKELFVKYKKRKEKDNLNRISGRLNALRKTRDNLKSIISQSGDNKNLRDKLQKYKNDIKETRVLRYLEGQIDKQLANKLVVTWKDLLKLREEQGYQNSQLKLNIQKIPKDVKTDKVIWDASIKQEVEEIFEELNTDYEAAVQNYEEKHKIWSQNYQRERKKKTECQDLTERLSDTEITNELESDDNEYSEEEPKPPRPIIIGDVKAQVLKNYKESFRQPGEPELEFFLSKLTNLDSSIHNDKEDLRRAAVNRCVVFIKLFYNGKEVCRSKPSPLKQNFTVKISQRFAIRILEWPESLMIEIYEESGALNRNVLVPGVYLPLPDPFSTVQNSEIVKHEFSSNLSVTYSHSAVGSGNKIIPCPKGSDFNNQPVCLYTTGTISYRIGWAMDNGKILSPPEKYLTKKKENLHTSLYEILKSGGGFELSKLKEWAEYSNLDPNDPYNSAFFHFIENTGDLEKNPSYFRLNPLADEFRFCRASEIEDNIRLELLKLRNMDEPEFREIKMVPLNQKEIHKEILKDYKRRLSLPQTLTDVLTSDLFDGHREWSKKYLEQVQQNLLKQYRMSKQNKKFQDIITEETIPDVGTLGLTFMQWFRPKRPLRPVRKERKKITPQNLSGHEINIVVNVVRAFEVPVRKDLDVIPGKKSFEGFSLVNVRPFVEISFRGKTARTTAAEGANPTWNQDLQIPIKSKSGCFPPGDLQSIKNTLYLHLFDEIIIDLVEEECARETSIHQRLERHWLASTEIPFSTLYFNSKIEGTFKLYSPPVLLGYEREAHRSNFSGTSGQEPSVPQRDATYITLFVTVQPALNPPKPVEKKMESRETSGLKKHLEGWHQEVTNMFPYRKVKTLVLDFTGKSVCVTRYIKPLPPPPIESEGTITPEMVARFVAMIPTTAKSSTFPRFFDIWLTCDQTLKLICGDSEDHAILLCSYFLSLGLEAFILLGSGIPHGSMAYVLVKEKRDKRNEYFVWDPTNGQKYNADDSFCPLQKVYCIINEQNIWANIQAEELPRRTRFDLTKKADWLPAFRKNMAPPTGSIQPHTLDYRQTSRQAVNILQDKIEKKLRDNIMKWRHKNRTQWNRYCAATLRKLLPKLEESMWNSGEHSPNHTAELQHILASHKMCGFPINAAYTGIEAVSEAVKATGVHCNETEGVEFALAVYVHPYPNDILSVWVYVASLVRKR